MTSHNEPRAPDDIQADIERTRSDLDETLHTLENRLTPGELMDQGWAYLRRNGTRDYIERLGESVKQDPIPLALVGVGLAWLMLSDRGRSPPAEADEDSGLVTSMQDAASSMKESVSQTTQKVSDKAHAARDRATQFADTARERATQVADTAREQAQRVRGGYQHLVNEQPLALGAVGLAIGALMAAAAPRTRQEDSVMGPTKERFKEDTEQELTKQNVAEQDFAPEPGKEPELEAEPAGPAPYPVSHARPSPP